MPTARRGLKDLFAEAARMGMPALAMTDHGNVFGAYDFYKQARPPGHQADHRHGGLRRARHAGSTTPRVWGDWRRGRRLRQRRLHPHDDAGRRRRGAAQPVPAVVAGEPGGLYYKPRMDRELLSLRQGDHRDHRLPVRRGADPAAARRLRRRPGRPRPSYRDIFGQDNFYLELMDHGLGIERRLRDDLLRLAQALGSRPLATNDLHYTYPSDAEAHEVLLCVQSGTTLADPNRFKFDAHDFYLKSAAEMRELWDARCPRPATTRC